MPWEGGLTRGAPTVEIMWAHTRGGGHPQGGPLRFSALCGRTHGGEGTHEGCPYGLDYVEAHMHGGGEGAPTRGAPTVG